VRNWSSFCGWGRRSGTPPASANRHSELGIPTAAKLEALGVGKHGWGRKGTKFEAGSFTWARPGWVSLGVAEADSYF
jgi:hypothetical protein